MLVVLGAHKEGPQNPSLDVNRIILVSVSWTYHTNKVGDLVSMYFLSLLSSIMVYAIELKQCLWYGSGRLVTVPAVP